MSMEVNNTHAGNNRAAEELKQNSGEQARRSTTQNDGDIRERDRNDSVEFSREAHSLRRLQERLEGQEAYDQHRVDEIRSAIRDGRYPVDPERLARNFVELETQLNQ